MEQAQSAGGRATGSQEAPSKRSSSFGSGQGNPSRAAPVIVITGGMIGHGGAFGGDALVSHSFPRRIPARRVGAGRGASGAG
jgi:hypothetical protein